MKEQEEFLNDVIFIDLQGNSHNIDYISESERFRQLFNSFHILYRPLISIFNKHNCVVTFDDSSDKLEMFRLSNITDEVCNECLKYNIKI